MFRIEQVRFAVVRRRAAVVDSQLGGEADQQCRDRGIVGGLPEGLVKLEVPGTRLGAFGCSAAELV
ncbi:Uncharacterised protein [Mycobacteroides abscessus subsp. abscessus]|nr:Uncharacterised protein [Mycobacteroides abscessus subsp. abscessus]